jgi:peroxiredoxin
MRAAGDLAPSFTLRRTGGERWSWDAESADGPVLLAILETDCPTCRLVVPYLKRLDEALSSSPGRVIAISQDSEEDTRQMVESLCIELTMLLDRDLEVSRLFDPSSVPALYLMEANGRIEFSAVGFDKGDLNEIASRMFVGLDLHPQTIAEPNDGAPASKPGCASRHLEPAVGATLDSAPPIDLRPKTGARATRVAVDDDVDLHDYCMETGFADCLPVVPPTAARVDRLLAATPLSGEQVIGLVPPCYGEATIEKIAANAVMAGCRPEHMEALVPLVRAACDERFNLHGLQATTHSATPLAIVSGEIVTRLGFNSGAGLFSNAARANSSVGRAFQLVIANLGGALPGEIDMSTLGNPGKFAYCIAEDHAANPWEPLHVELGFAAHDNTVTLFGAAGIQEVSEHTARSGATLLQTIAATLAVIWSWRVCGRIEAMLIVSPEHAATLAADGFSKANVREFLFEHTGVPLRAFDHQGAEGTQLRHTYEEIVIDGEPHYRKFGDPSQIRIVVAGGTAGKFSAVIGGWPTGPGGTEIVTYPVAW